MGKIIKILVVLALIIVVGLAALIFTTDINQYKDQIVQVVKDNTGRDFQISGDLKLAPSLVPTIAVEGVSLGNTDWAKEKNMLSVAKFEAQVSLIPLLKKNIQVNRLILLEPNIHLETDKNGKGNWVFEAMQQKQEHAKSDETASTSAAGLPALAINEVQIEKANISYKDGKTGKTTEVVIDEITVSSSSFSEPMELAIKAAINNSPLSATATLGSIDNLLANKNYPIKLNADLAGVKMNVDGQLAQPMAAKGIDMQVALDINKLSDLNEVAGSELPDTGPIIFNGQIADTKSGYAIKGMSTQLLEYKLGGDLEVIMSGPRPKLIANISSEQLDVSPFQTEPEETVKKEKLFPSDPLPLEGLKAADVDLKFATKRLITKDLIINDVKLTLKLNNGKLQIAPLSAKAAGGTLNVDISLDGSDGKNAVLSNKIDIKQIELGQLPTVKEKQLLTGGKTDININLKGSGTSVAVIMAGLNGKLLVKAGKGNISSKALEFASADALLSTLSMLTPGTKKSDGSILECAVVNFDIKDGIATADNGIGISTNKMNVLGAGNINLKTEQLDLGITPNAKEGVGLNAGQLAGLVRLGGTLANPSPKADTKAALKTGLEVGTAVATGGLSLLAQGLLGGSDSDQNPCDIALGIAPKKTATKEKTKEEKNTVEKTTDTVKDAAGAIGDKLKSLF